MKGGSNKRPLKMEDSVGVLEVFDVLVVGNTVNPLLRYRSKES